MPTGRSRASLLYHQTHGSDLLPDTISPGDWTHFWPGIFVLDCCCSVAATAAAAAATDILQVEAFFGYCDWLETAT